MKKTIVTKEGISKRDLSSTEMQQVELDKIENERLGDLQIKEKRKKELIEIMTQANALRDDVAWQEAKDEYDLIMGK